MLNYVAAPQGPSIGRSGTLFMNKVYDRTKESTIIPFVFSDTDYFLLEFTDLRVRFFTEAGILTYTPVAMTITSDSPFKIDSATLAANVGDEVAFSGLDGTYGLNGDVYKITAKVGTVYTLSVPRPGIVFPVAGMVARVYHIVSPYSHVQALDVEDRSSLDVIYLMHPTVKPYKLKRYNTYNWVFEAVVFKDGPYLPINEGKTTLKPSATGRATPNMTSNILPAGSTASGTSHLGAQDFYLAFNGDSESYWQSDDDQTGSITYTSTTAFICDGFQIVLKAASTDANYTSKDYAPANFTLYGDGVELARYRDYILYDQHRSVFFEIPNQTACLAYRLEITAVGRNGAVKPKIAELVFRSTVSTSIDITASSVTDINDGLGFLATDVGRTLRIKGTDDVWRWLTITARTSTTVVTATLNSAPFPDLLAVQDWRLGAWSETTGYPNTSWFYQDRLWLAGSTTAPDFFAASEVGKYESMSPSTEGGEVLDTNAIMARLNARKLSRIRWIAGTKNGLLMGTGSQEFIIKVPDGSQKNITPATVGALEMGSRGSADVSPEAIDNQVLFVQRAGRAVRELAYDYSIDNYKAPSMSLLSSHLGGASPFLEVAYAAEPYSILWVRRENGTLVGLTYNRDENAVGWHRHDISDGFIKSIAVLPSANKTQDILWMVVLRHVNGVDEQYIEKLMPFWDFNDTVATAHYVDCGLRYSGAATSVIYGLEHLEGQNVYGLADELPVGPLLVTDGSITLPSPIEEGVFGLGFDASGETSRLENGAVDGTAIGKSKRLHGISAMVWGSYGGEVGTWNEDIQAIVYAPLEYPVADASLVETITLFSGIVGPITPAPGYEKHGSVAYRRPKESPLPFNLVALMPQLETQDRG